MEVKNLQIAICDDSMEELFYVSSLLQDYCISRDVSLSCRTFLYAKELVAAIKTQQFDLFLLDILMPSITGMQIAKEIRKIDKNVPIIFLTSSKEFAIEGYRVRAFDYMLKPVEKNEFSLQLDKLFEELNSNVNSIPLKTSTGIHKIPIQKIVYVEVMSRNLKFLLSNGEEHQIYGYLSTYEDTLLSYAVFFKPHRSFILNFDYVIQLNKSGLTTTIGKVVPVSRSNFVKTKTAYMKYLLGKVDQ